MTLKNNLNAEGVEEELIKTPLTEEEKAELLTHMPTESETQCGIPALQLLASKKSFTVLFGLTACIFSATYMYHTGTITTLEKRYHIDTKKSGLIMAGHDLMMVVSAIVLAYFAAKGHRPRWMALGAFFMALYCLLMFLPHWLYGAGEDAYMLTKEYAQSQMNLSAEAVLAEKMKDLCDNGRGEEDCTKPPPDTTIPQIMLFTANMISGLAGPLFFNLGYTYMDDNVRKVEAPIYFSLISFLKMLGPPFGAAVAAIFLKLYIVPSLSPVIDNTDPRWMGAWWAGWIVFSIYFIFMAVIFYFFPRTLPRGAYRKRELIKKILEGKEKRDALKVVEKASMQDIKRTFMRLVTNKVYIFNLLAGCFYCFGYLPFWTYQAKYIESQYLLSASTSSLVTGTVSLVFSSIGILASGFVISKFKPKARTLALWNICTSIVSIFGVASYVFNGCVANDNNLILQNSNISLCNQNCNCDYIKYSPVCGADNRTYVSPCHAGCSDKITFDNGTVVFNECSCISRPMSSIDFEHGSVATLISNDSPLFSSVNEFKKEARTGVCPIDCMSEFYMFFIILCLNKFIGGTEGSSNFLLGIRCVDERDRTVSMGLTITVLSIVALLPSPIFFGALMDSTCLLWGKTCSKKGNCWLYDTSAMRYRINLIAAGFVFIGTLFDVGTWYYSKTVEIFDKEETDEKQLPFDKELEMSPLRKKSIC